MTNHPNRSNSRPVCDATDKAQILGHASSESEALMILRRHFGPDVPIASAQRRDVILARDLDGHRSIRAWVPVQST